MEAEVTIAKEKPSREAGPYEEMSAGNVQSQSDNTTNGDGTQEPNTSLAIYHLARLLAGASDANPSIITASFPDLSLGGNGADRDAVRAWLESHPDVHTAVLATDPSTPPTTRATVSPVDVPELPGTARLTPEQEQQADTAGMWLTSYVDYAAQKSPCTPRLFHEATGLVIGGMAIARRLRVRMTHADIWPNLYALMVAPTTLYAKTVALRIGVDLIEGAIPHLRLSSEFTPEALLSDLAGREPTGLQDAREDTRNLWAAGRNFAAQRGIILDEASALFAGFKRDYMVGMAEMLLRLYDAPRKYTRNTRGGGLVVVKAAALSFLGATTPSSLQRAGVAIGWHSGMFARFALLTPDAPPIYSYNETRPDPPIELGSTLGRLANELLPVPTYPDLPEAQDAAIDADAHAAWRRYDRAMRFDLLTAENKPDGRLWGCYGRMPTQALKVALILAALDWAAGEMSTPRITLAHWARGQMIAERWRASAHRLLWAITGEAQAEDDDRAVVLLRRTGDEGVTAREAGQMLHLSRQKVEPMLDCLVKDGIAETFIPPGGRATRYRIPRKV